MKTTLILLLLPSMLFCIPISTKDSWGATGHRVVGELAAQRIKKRTAKKINELLDGVSLAQISTYADDIKSDSHFSEYSPWHYANIKQDETYISSVKNEKGDIVFAIEKCIQVIQSSSSSRDDKQFHLKLLIHFVGDIHQPMHLGNLDDRGGNDIKIKWFGRNSNLHRLWDSDMIDNYGMSYSELAINLPNYSEDNLNKIAKAPLMEWVNESQELAKKLYYTLPKNTNLGYRYLYDHFDTVRFQLLKGGVRLAALLDQIFK